MRFLARYESLAFTALRVVAGILFALHGAQKLFAILGGKPVELVTQAGLGGVIELVCGLLVAVGLATRPAAFLASGTMAVAYFQFHWKLEMAAMKWVPLVNKGELAVIYCFLFLFIATRGPGPHSLDAKMAGRA